MREENTNQQQAEAPRVSRVREYMTAKFPDRQFADEDDYENTPYDYLAESDKKIAGHEAANKRIMEGSTGIPRVRADHRGRGERCAGGRLLLPDSSIRRNWPFQKVSPIMTHTKKAATERSQRLADMKARTEARDKNIAQSKTDVDAFFAEHGLDEAEQKQFVEWVDNEILANLLDGKVNKGILTKLYQGWIYDAAVADALETGKVEGRNEQIEAKRKQARKTDGLPADGGSVETPEQAETPKDMFDEVIERRNKRKF